MELRPARGLGPAEFFRDVTQRHVSFIAPVDVKELESFSVFDRPSANNGMLDNAFSRSSFSHVRSFPDSVPSFRALLGFSESSQRTFLADNVRFRLPRFPLPVRAGGHIQQRSEISLTQTDPLTFRFELFREDHSASSHL